MAFSSFEPVQFCEQKRLASLSTMIGAHAIARRPFAVEGGAPRHLCQSRAL